jgi:hypothetical protein
MQAWYFFFNFVTVPSVIISTSFLINWWISESVNKIEGFLIAAWITNRIWKLLLHFLYFSISSDQLFIDNFASSCVQSNWIKIKLDDFVVFLFLCFSIHFTLCCLLFPPQIIFSAAFFFFIIIHLWYAMWYFLYSFLILFTSHQLYLTIKMKFYIATATVVSFSGFCG